MKIQEGLTLKKETITNLSNQDMNSLFGGRQQHSQWEISGLNQNDPNWIQEVKRIMNLCAASNGDMSCNPQM